MRTRSVLSLVAAAAALLTYSGPATAQAGGSWGWTPGGGVQGDAWGMPPTVAPPTSSSGQSSDLEIGVLYGTAATYGVGAGIWIDAEAGIDDPGLMFIPPIVLGVAAPVGVFFLDDPPMPRGMPAAIATGMIAGAGEGLGVWSYQFTSASEEDAWGFRGLSRAMTLGGAVGAVGGYALAYYSPPSPKSSVLVGSSLIWGSLVGSMIGYGATDGDLDYGEANEGAALGGLIGYNVGLAGAAALSAVYVPSWSQLGWMWIGGGIGAAAGLPIYLAYAGSDKPAKRGLIFQGLTISLGVAAGGLFASRLQDEYAAAEQPEGTPQFAQISAFGLMPVEGGAGVQLIGTLF